MHYIHNGQCNKHYDSWLITVSCNVAMNLRMVIVLSSSDSTHIIHKSNPIQRYQLTSSYL